MKFIDSFAHYDLDGMLLKWDLLTVSDDYSLSFVTVSHESSGGKGIQIEGSEVILKKTGLEQMSPAVLAFRAALDGIMTVTFFYENFTLGSCRITDSTAFIVEPDGTETDINLEADSANSTFWEFKIVPELGGSFALYANETLKKSVSSDFYSVGNRVTGFQIKLEDVSETVISDLFISESQHGIKAVGCFFPSSDVEVEMAPSVAGDHYELVNNNPQEEASYVVSAYGQKDVYGYSISTENIFSVTAISLTALIGKDVGGDDVGLGVQGIEQVAGTDYPFSHVYPTSSVKFLQLITETQPSTGGSLTPGGIASLVAGIKVDNS